MKWRILATLVLVLFVTPSAAETNGPDAKAGEPPVADDPVEDVGEEADEDVGEAPVTEPAGPLHAADVMVAESIVLDHLLSPRLAERLVEVFRSELERAGHVVFSEAALEQLRTGTVTVDPRELSLAQAALDRGKEHYLEFELQAAHEALVEAVERFEPLIVSPEELPSLLEALAYLGDVRLNLEDEEGAREAFMQVLLRRPDHRLDSGIHPPRVLDAFETARAEAGRLARGNLVVSSSPPLARVTVDGLPRGETPVTVEDLVVGPHLVIVEAPEHRVWAQNVEITAEGTELALRLEPTRTGELLDALAEEAGEENTLETLVPIAAEVAKSAEVEATALLGLRVLRDQHYLAMALVDQERGARVVWTVVDDDFLRAREVVRTLVEKVFAADEPKFVDTGGKAPGVMPDFESHLLGFARPPPPELIDTVEAPPLAHRWWFWASVATVAALGAGGAYQVLRPADIVQLPDVIEFDWEVGR